MVHELFFSQNWFSRLDFFLQIFFLLITLIIAAYSFRIFRLSRQREIGLLSLSFFFLFLSYSLETVLHTYAINELNTAITVRDLLEAQTLQALGIYFHFFFFLLGLVTLTYLTLKFKSKRLYALLFILVVLPSVLLIDKYAIMYLLSAILLLFIVVAYMLDFFYHKNKKVMLTLIAFIFLFLGRFDFIFLNNNSFFFILGRIFELISYLTFLVDLFIIIRQKPVKRPLP